MAIQHTNALARIQIVDLATAKDPTVERWVNRQATVDGQPVGAPEFVKLKTRPLSSFKDLVALSRVADDDLEKPPAPTEE